MATTSNDKTIKKSLPFTSADFDGLKAKLITFLQSQPQLADYNFDGSTINVLCDLLSLDAQGLAFFLNMVGNEALSIKTAVRRDSVVARSADHGYFAKTIRSSKTTLWVQLVPTGSPSYITIPKGSVFPASGNGVSFNFLNMDDYQVFRDINGNYICPSVPVYEGKFLTYTYTIDQAALDLGITIPNANVDNTLLRVSVAENSSSDIFVYYSLADNVVNLDSSSTVYFLKDDSGFVNVYFGDGVIGNQPPIGAVVKIYYPISSGDAANGIVNFTLGSSISGVTSSTVVANSATYGGAPAESIASIKLNAPLASQTQDRAVTSLDYGAIVEKYYANAQAAISWGGEDANPPQYGKVFIAVKPYSGYYLTTTEKQTIQNIVKKKNVSGITPVVVDPDYIFLKIACTFDYDGSATTYTSGQLQTIVQNRILSFGQVSLNTFDQMFRHSVFSRMIDNSDPSIISNIFTVVLEKRIFPLLNTSITIDSLFNNALVPGSFKSTTFTYNGNSACYFADDGNGNIGIYYVNSSITYTVKTNVGTINYSTGEVFIKSIILSAISNAASQQEVETGAYYMSFTATPSTPDISPNGQQILQITVVNTTPNEINNFVS